MSKKYLLLAITCIFLLTTGCSTYLSFDVDWGYNQYLETPKAISVDEKSPNGSVELTLIAPEKCGCYLEKADHRKEIVEDVPYQCIGFPLYTDKPGEEIKQKINDDNAKAFQNYVFNSFGKVTKICLERQLGAYFNHVDINLKSTGDSESSETFSTMSYYTKSSKTADKFMLVKLIAKSNDGKIIEGIGNATNKLGNGHLVWMIPLGVATFPIGTTIGVIIFNNSYNALMNKTIAEAIDVAAADLSKKLADELAQNKNQQFEVYVMLE